MSKYIVTGGSGFVGGALARRLSEEGHEVHAISRRRVPKLEEIGVCCQQIDLAHTEGRLPEVFAGAEAVFHVAAKVDMWGRYEDFYRTNVQATQEIIETCRAVGVPRLIFTSSPSVIADGNDLVGVDESYPYPEHYHAFYPQTKAMAERAVLSAHEPGVFETCALRPHLIWGPGDTNLIPTIMERAQAGRLIQVGNGDNKVDLTFIADCVDAHVQAERALRENTNAGGRAYFISQGEPVNMWSWINEVLERSGQPPISRKIPSWFALSVAAVSEMIAKVLPGNREPFLTRFLASEMSTSHYFDIGAARKLLGFNPQYSIAEAMEITFPTSDSSLVVNG